MTDTDGSPAVDWDQLQEAAVAAMRMAYAPYSGYPVGVAGIVDDGRVVSGCNVENASYGLTLCAECGMVSSLAASGGGRLRAVLCVDGKEQVIMPCGRCRQLLSEHADADSQVMTPRGPRSMAEVLPQAFGAHDLDHD